MSRTARTIIPGIPHHITQRGNRRQPVFFQEEDRQLYLRILIEQSRRYGLQIWAYCLMGNHIHMVVVPEKASSLASGIGETHRRYTRYVNLREGWTGYLWQGRFASFPLGEHHLYAAVRYVERNPVRAGVVRLAEEYPWSSARAHVLGIADPVLSECFLLKEIQDWARYLRELDEVELLEEMREHTHNGRPWGC